MLSDSFFPVNLHGKKTLIVCLCLFSGAASIYFKIPVHLCNALRKLQHNSHYVVIWLMRDFIVKVLRSKYSGSRKEVVFFVLFLYRLHSDDCHLSDCDYNGTDRSHSTFMKGEVCGISILL